jgi:hypothetical protein
LNFFIICSTFLCSRFLVSQFYFRWAWTVCVVRRESCCWAKHNIILKIYIKSGSCLAWEMVNFTRKKIYDFFSRIDIKFPLKMKIKSSAGGDMWLNWLTYHNLNFHLPYQIVITKSETVVSMHVFEFTAFKIQILLFLFMKFCAPKKRKKNALSKIKTSILHCFKNENPVHKQKPSFQSTHLQLNSNLGGFLQEHSNICALMIHDIHFLLWACELLSSMSSSSSYPLSSSAVCVYFSPRCSFVS